MKQLSVLLSLLRRRSIGAAAADICSGNCATWLCRRSSVGDVSSQAIAAWRAARHPGAAVTVGGRRGGAVAGGVSLDVSEDTSYLGISFSSDVFRNHSCTTPSLSGAPPVGAACVPAVARDASFILVDPAARRSLNERPSMHPPHAKTGILATLSSHVEMCADARRQAAGMTKLCAHMQRRGARWLGADGQVPRSDGRTPADAKPITAVATEDRHHRQPPRSRAGGQVRRQPAARPPRRDGSKEGSGYFIPCLLYTSDAAVE